LPFPITLDTVVARVTTDAVVRPSDTRSQILRWPHLLSVADFEQWNGDLARAVPVSFDPRYRSVLSTKDIGDQTTNATILTSTVGKGSIVYTTLTIDSQLAAAHPGAARLIVNLLAAGLRPDKVN
jgi:hypothetical protein